MKNQSTRKPIQSLVLCVILNLGLFTWIQAQENHCKPNNVPGGVIKSVTVNDQNTPFTAYPIGIQDSVQLQLNPTAMSQYPVIYWKGWIDMNQNGIFEESEVLLTNGPVAEPLLKLPLDLPDSMTFGVPYTVRFAATQSIHTESCGELLDYRDGTLKRDGDPFTVEVNNDELHNPSVIYGLEKDYCVRSSDSFTEPIRVLVSSNIGSCRNQDLFVRTYVINQCGNTIIQNHSSHGMNYLDYSQVQLLNGQPAIDIINNFDISFNSCLIQNGFYLIRMEVYQRCPMSTEELGVIELNNDPQLLAVAEVKVTMCPAETEDNQDDYQLSGRMHQAELVEDLVESFKVFPNPVLEEIVISHEHNSQRPRRYLLTDLNGKIMMTIESPEKEFSTDLRNVKQGMYLLISADGIDRAQIIKK